jgi:hypothetical protein
VIQEPALPPDKPLFRLGWILLTLIAGWAGSLGAVAAFGSGTYTVAPFEVKLRVEPSTIGRTMLEVEPAPGINPGHASAETHTSYLSFRATVTGLTASTNALGAANAATLVADPKAMVGFLEQDGRSAVRSFAIKVGVLSLGGGLVGGVVVSMGRWKRMLGGAIAGLVLIGALGAAAGLTYDANQLRNLRFAPSSSAARAP